MFALIKTWVGQIYLSSLSFPFKEGYYFSLFIANIVAPVVDAFGCLFCSDCLWNLAS